MKNAITIKVTPTPHYSSKSNQNKKQKTEPFPPISKKITLTSELCKIHRKAKFHYYGHNSVTQREVHKLQKVPLTSIVHIVIRLTTWRCSYSNNNGACSNSCGLKRVHTSLQKHKKMKTTRLKKIHTRGHT